MVVRIFCTISFSSFALLYVGVCIAEWEIFIFVLSHFSFISIRRILLYLESFLFNTVKRFCDNKI